MDNNPLADISLFAELQPGELNDLAAQARIRTFPKNAILINEGDLNASMYVLLSGTVKVYTSDGEGREALLRTFGPGDYFGELTLLDEQPRSASVMTLEPCKVMILTRDALIDCLQRHSTMAIGLLKVLSGKLRRQSAITKDLALLSVYERLVKLLRELAREQDGLLVVEGVSQRKLADQVFASREMITLILKELKQGGYIDTDRKRIVLKKRLPERW